MLNKPLPQVQSLTRSQPEPSPVDSHPKTEKEKTIEKARIIFGTRLAGPGERKKELDEASTMVAGIMVPPKPTEPDNCCMSGCVNCVWDLYRDEMEEWAEKSAQARAAMKAQRLQHEAKAGSNAAGSTQAVSMDDDGGGSETNWTDETNKGDLFADIPVGIRAFMETEKKLKQMHEREKTNVA
jgi:predicted  nucleic acid-binding Zn-ribbon protein